MPFRYLTKKGRQDRFERFNIVVSILLAGWVPSILTVWFSYAFLTKMLESSILRDRQTFVQLISRLVGDDLSGTEGIIDYYQTLPDVSQLLNSSNRPPSFHDSIRRQIKLPSHRSKRTSAIHERFSTQSRNLLSARIDPPQGN